jgi:glycosyltransferase involved in cell wall biosynthesis
MGPRAGGVLYVGRILPHKGINYLVEAMPADLPLTIMGQVADERFLGDLRRLARGKHVTFRHDADDAALVAAYRSALCVVLPSVYRTLYGQETLVPELLGQTLLEAMACGAPVLATNVASLPEVVEDGVTGFLVPPNDSVGLQAKLESFRAQPDRTTRMGAAARRRVEERFTWPAVVARCLGVYSV